MLGGAARAIKNINVLACIGSIWAIKFYWQDKFL